MRYLLTRFTILAKEGASGQPTVEVEAEKRGSGQPTLGLRPARHLEQGPPITGTEMKKAKLPHFFLFPFRGEQW